MGYLNEDGLSKLVSKIKGQVIELTAAEYEQIDPSIKNYDNKLYFISDYTYNYPVDEEPVANSNKLVKSGGIYNWTSKIGSGSLITTAQTLIPAVNEIKNACDSASSCAVLQFLSTGWSTEDVGGVTYYTQSVQVTSIFSEYPDVSLVPISGVLPTSAEEQAFNAVSYFTANDTTNVIKGYALTAPTDTFAVAVKGVSNV